MQKHPDKIYNVCDTQLSIARFYGGINYNGVYYKYDATTDTLTRGDLVKKQPLDAKKEREKWEGMRVTQKDLDF